MLRLNFNSPLFEISAGQTFLSRGPDVARGPPIEEPCFKVCVKRILRIVSKHITNVRNVLLKHITKTLKYVVLNCGVKPLNSFSPILCSGFFGRG